MCEHEDGSVTEIESRDVNFLEEEFLSKGEVNQDSNFYELDESTPNCSVEQKDSEPALPGKVEETTL